jgi:hypothetical protein
VNLDCDLDSIGWDSWYNKNINNKIFKRKMEFKILILLSFFKKFKKKSNNSPYFWKYKYREKNYEI